MTEIGMALTNPLEGERTPGRSHTVREISMTEIGMALTNQLEGERTPGRSNSVRDKWHDRNRHGSHQSIRRGENTR